MVSGVYGNDPKTRIDYDRMRKYRLERAREQMEKYGIGVIITLDDSNMLYLSGSRGLYENGCVIFPRNGDPYLYMAGTHLSTLLNMMPWLKGNIRVGMRPRPCDCVTKEDCQHIVQELTQIMDEHGLRNEPVVIDGTTAAVLIQEALMDAGIKTTYDLRFMTEAKKMKNQDELECLRIACATTDAFFTAFKDEIKPGLTEMELIGAGTNALYRLGCSFIPDFAVASGERTNPPQLEFTDRQIRPGDLVFIDPHNPFDGFEACCYRTFCCGKTTTEQKEIYEEARSMLYAGLSAVKAGNTALDVVEKWPSDPHRFGADSWDEADCLVSGHGIGLGREGDYPKRFHPGVPPDKLKEIVFEENMTLAIEVWNGKPGGKEGVYIEEDIVVTKSGYDLLTKFPVDEITECWD